MTNFLTRLVGRTLGTMPLVQPRIASIYDPGDFESRGLQEQGSRGAEDSRSRGEREFYSLGKAATEISNHPISTNSVDKALPNNSEIKTKQNNSEVAAIFIEDELVIKARPNIKSRAGETPTPQEFLERSRAGETPTPQEFLERSRAGETPTPQEFLERSSRDKVELTSVMQEPLSAMSPRITTKVDRSVEKNEQKAISLSDEIAFIQEYNQPESQQNFPNTSSGRDEEMGNLPITNYQSPITNYQLPITQTIRVSIGRIEVRAIPTPPASPAPRKSMPTPKLSLSEYLRQNGGGG